MTVIEAELAQVRLDVRTLDRLVYEANIKNSVDFKGEKLVLVEAIELATQLRAELNCVNSLVCMKKRVYAWVMVKIQCFMKLLCMSQMSTVSVLLN